MRHIDADAALRNKTLMKIFKNRTEQARVNSLGASIDDHLTRLVSVSQERLIQSILDELEEACKVHDTTPEEASEE